MMVSEFSDAGEGRRCKVNVSKRRANGIQLDGLLEEHLQWRPRGEWEDIQVEYQGVYEQEGCDAGNVEMELRRKRGCRKNDEEAQQCFSTIDYTFVKLGWC